MNDGILEPIQIELRPISVLLRQPDDISKDGHVVPVGLVKDILPLFVGQSNSESCVILCSNQGTAKELTRLIESALRLNRDGTTNRPVTIVSSSGLSGQPNRLSSYREDAILVMTSAMIRSFDWKTIALTIVLTPLSNEKLRELAFRRVRPGKLPPRRIIDYAGNVWPTTT